MAVLGVFLTLFFFLELADRLNQKKVWQHIIDIAPKSGVFEAPLIR